MHAAAAPARGDLEIGPVSSGSVALASLRRAWFFGVGREVPEMPEALRWVGAWFNGRLLAAVGYLDVDIPSPQRWLYELYRAPGWDADAIRAARAVVTSMRETTRGKRKLIATLPAPKENVLLERYLTSVGARCGAQVWEFSE